MVYDPSKDAVVQRMKNQALSMVNYYQATPYTGRPQYEEVPEPEYKLSPVPEPPEYSPLDHARHEQMRRKLWMDVYTISIGREDRSYSADGSASNALKRFDSKFPEPIRWPAEKDETSIEYKTESFDI